MVLACEAVRTGNRKRGGEVSGKIRNPARRCKICGGKCKKQMRYCKLCMKERREILTQSRRDAECAERVEK